MPSSFLSQSSHGTSSFCRPREQPDHGKWFENHPQEQSLQVVSQFDSAAVKRWRGAFPGSQPLHIAWFLSRAPAGQSCPVSVVCLGQSLVQPCVLLWRVQALGRGTWCSRALLCLGGAHTEHHKCGEMGQSSSSSKCGWQSSVRLDTGWSPFVHLWAPCVLGCLPSSFCSLLANQRNPSVLSKSCSSFPSALLLCALSITSSRGYPLSGLILHPCASELQES